MCGCGRTSMPRPGASCAGPIWSKKMNGPDRRPLAVRQGAVDLEPAEIVGGGKQGLEEGIVGHGVILAVLAGEAKMRRSHLLMWRAIAATRGS